MRSQRKDEHIRTYLQETFQGDPLFSSVALFHHALPEMALKDVDTSLVWGGKILAMPLFINAITGGTTQSLEINTALAHVAAKFSIPIAAGSARIALESREAEASFRIIRKCYPHGIVWANIGADATVEECRQVVALLDANGLQIHLNAAQELMMEEGDRDFSRWLTRIGELTASLSVPVIVKEVGTGLDPWSIQALYDVGVRHVDVGGLGGTNFMQIERSRAEDGYDFSSLTQWGNPTAWCLAKAKELALPDLHVYGSGGITTPMDITKALVLGAELVGIGGPLLAKYFHFGEEGVMDFIANLHEGLKRMMVLCGAKRPADLRQVPFRLMSPLKDLL